jgi:hypothetical protein
VEATLSTHETNITWFIFIISNFTFLSSSILPSPKKVPQCRPFDHAGKKVECPWIFVKNTKQG